MFGTCGDSTFRQDLFIPEYDRLDVTYFNPQVDDWRPELADIEADHLAYDMVQTWPVLSSTYGTGSLAETGFSIASSLRTESPLPKFVLPMIEQDLDPDLDDEVARTESLRSRRLVAAHLEKSPSPNVFIVDSLEEMLEKSIILYGVAQQLVDLSQSNNPAYQRFMAGRTEREAYRQAMESGRLGTAARDLT